MLMQPVGMALATRGRGYNTIVPPPSLGRRTPEGSAARGYSLIDSQREKWSSRMLSS
jgi:hypothetical protein